MTHRSTDISRLPVVRQVDRTIQRHAMLAPKDRVLVAVSGGADSTALLHILQALAPGYGIDLAVAHLNHGLRGRAANADARFVRDMSRHLGRPFHGGRIRLDPSGGSLEERGRQARYEFYYKLAQENGYTKIALGHHMDDNAEAVLMHLLRGSGTRGLAGIPPVRGERIIRPLMDLRHTDIVNFLETNDISFVEDSSNTDLRFYRNRIRHQLIPLLQDTYNANVVAALHRTAGLCREEEGWLQGHLAPLLEETITRLDSQHLQMRIHPLSGVQLAIQRRLFRDGLRKWRGDLRRINADHIDSLIGLLPSSSEGKQLCLPNRIGVLRRPHSLLFTLRQGRACQPIRPSPDYAYRIPLQQDAPYTVKIPEAGLRLAFSLLTSLKEIQPNGADLHTAWFDADLLTFPLTIRNFKPGDRMIPSGMRGHQKIKKIFGDRKIPLARRHKIPILVSGDIILWVAGIRQSGLAALSGQTKQALKVEMINALK